MEIQSRLNQGLGLLSSTSLSTDEIGRDILVSREETCQLQISIRLEKPFWGAAESRRDMIFLSHAPALAPAPARPAHTQQYSYTALPLAGMKVSYLTPSC
jgi:hypothetical protein